MNGSDHQDDETSLYFKSVSAELTALKNRVRHFIRDAHWQTDGQWKESVLKSLLRNHVPGNIAVGSGFLIQSAEASAQIDVLLHGHNAPVWFKDGDLVMVSPAATRAIIEVKSKIHDTSHLKDVLHTLRKKCEFVNQHVGAFENPPFVGLFAYEASISYKAAVEACRDAFIDQGPSQYHCVIDHLALGPDHFVRFWRKDPVGNAGAIYRSYDLGDRAFGYFIRNLMYEVSRPHFVDDPNLWFPAGGKEKYGRWTEEIEWGL